MTWPSLTPIRPLPITSWEAYSRLDLLVTIFSRDCFSLSRFLFHSPFFPSRIESTHLNYTLEQSVYFISLFRTTFFPYQSNSQLQWQYQISKIKNNQITPWAQKVMIQTQSMRSRLWLLQVGCLRWRRELVISSTNPLPDFRP